MAVWRNAGEGSRRRENRRVIHCLLASLTGFEPVSARFWKPKSVSALARFWKRKRWFESRRGATVAYRGLPLVSRFAGEILEKAMITMDTSPEFKALLERLREQENLATESDVIRRAIALYDAELAKKGGAAAKDRAGPGQLPAYPRPRKAGPVPSPARDVSARWIACLRGLRLQRRGLGCRSEAKRSDRQLSGHALRGPRKRRGEVIRRRRQSHPAPPRRPHAGARCPRRSCGRWCGRPRGPRPA